MLTTDRPPSPDAEPWIPVRSWVLAAFCALALLATFGDHAASTWAEGLSPSGRTIALAVTALGNSGYMFAGSALVAALAWWGCRSTREAQVRADLSRRLERALFFFLVIAASGLAAQVLKHLVGRARPRADALNAFAFHPLSLSNAFASFPSGHTTSAFAAVTALGLMTSRGRGLLLALAVAIGASRVALHEHYPSDVLGGAALGAAVTFGLARASGPSAAIRSVRAWLIEGRGAGGPDRPRGRSGHDWALAFGQVLDRNRRWFPPALVAGLFALAVPPADLFGSEAAEHVKDSCAILIALAGLTVRALVAGFGHGPRSGPRLLETKGLYSLCRHPLYAGNILIFTGIFLMHGNRWTVLLGTLTYVLMVLAIVRAEEADLRHAFGTAYEDYHRQVPRWWPRAVRPMQVAGGLRFDLRRALNIEYGVIGMTVIALAAAEFYEEIEEPLVGGQIVWLACLGALILGVSLAIASAWLAGKSRLTSP